MDAVEVVSRTAAIAPALSTALITPANVCGQSTSAVTRARRPPRGDDRAPEVRRCPISPGRGGLRPHRGLPSRYAGHRLAGALPQPRCGRAGACGGSRRHVTGHQRSRRSVAVTRRFELDSCRWVVSGDFSVKFNVLSRKMRSAEQRRETARRGCALLRTLSRPEYGPGRPEPAVTHVKASPARALFPPASPAPMTGLGTSPARRMCVRRPQIWFRPPSTYRLEPVMKLLWPEARKSTAAAISSGRASLPSGT